MLLKTLWDINSNRNNLWIWWIHAFYLYRKDVWTWKHGQADHPLFKNVQKLRDKLIEATGTVNRAKQLLSSWFKNGRFSTPLAYDWLRVKHTKKPWMTLIWKTYIPPKFSFILWLSMRGNLNTNDKWLIQTEDRSYAFCKRVPESIAHLFFQCTFVKAIWQRVRCWLMVGKAMITLHSAVKWIKKYFGGAHIQSKAVVLAFAAIVYAVWSARNKVIFAGASLSSADILKNIQISVLTVLHNLYLVECLYFMHV